MWYLRLIAQFQKASAQQEMAYRANFFISILHSLLNLGTGVLGLVVLFGQVQVIQGWEMPAALTLLGVYLTIGGLRNLCFGPSLDRLAGMDGEIWTGKFDFTLLRPVSVQFLASFRHWQLFALFDLLLALGTLGAGIAQLQHALTWIQIAMLDLKQFNLRTQHLQVAGHPGGLGLGAGFGKLRDDDRGQDAQDHDDD